MSFVVNKMLFIIKKKNQKQNFFEVKCLNTEKCKILF